MKNFEINFSDNKSFLLIEASKLSKRDEFLRYKAKTKEEVVFRQLLVTSIKEGLSDFYCPINITQSINSRKKLVKGKTYIEWEKFARKLTYGKSFLGNQTEYIVFLGVFLKKLIDSGWLIEDSWRAICSDIEVLDNYFSKVSINEENNELFYFYEIAKKQKLVSDNKEEDCFWIVSEKDALNTHSKYPLAKFSLCNNLHYKSENIVGWIIFKE